MQSTTFCLCLLGIGYFLGTSVLFAHVTTTSLVARNFSQNIDQLAMLPISILIGSSALVIAPAGFIMQRLNYKPVFWFGATVGILSGLICTVAVFLADGTLTLVLLAIGSVPQGISYGIINYYRHLASCIGQADENSRSWQIAIVVTGGVFAGIVGPWVSTLAVHMIPGHEYVGSYVFITVANLLHFALLMFVKLDRLPLGTQPGSKDSLTAKPSTPSPISNGNSLKRPLRTVITQGDYLYAMLSAMAAHTAMTVLMSVAPLSLTSVEKQTPLWISPLVIQIHVVFMHLPSLVTSKLIGRFGSRQVVLFGMIIASCGALIYIGDTSIFIAISLAVLGLGWNFCFVGATTTLASTYNAEEKFTAQALNDTVVFGTSAVMTLLAGPMQHVAGGATPLAIGFGAILVIFSLAEAIYLAKGAFKGLRTRRVVKDLLMIQNCSKKIDEQATVCSKQSHSYINLSFHQQLPKIDPEIFDSGTAVQQVIKHFGTKLQATHSSIVSSENQSNISTLVTMTPIANSNRVLRLEFSSTENRDSAYEWLKTHGDQIDILLGTLLKNVAKDRENHTSIENESSSQRNSDSINSVLMGIADLFEKKLIKRSYGKKSIVDVWDSEGRRSFMQACQPYVELGKPILFVLPAFPFKSGNQRTKVISALPDMGEKLALQRLENFLTSVRQIYEPGAKLIIFSDGRVYCDLMGISDETATKFKETIRQLSPSKNIHWLDLDIFFPSFSHNEKREALVDLFGSEMKEILIRIQTDSDFAETYLGFKAFLSEEHLLPGMSHKEKRAEIKSFAQRMMQRNDAYGRFVKSLFCQHVRLSIHPSTNSEKFSINLVGETDWGTPWHNCALLNPDGKWTLVRRSQAEAAGYSIQLSEDGLPYFSTIQFNSIKQQ